MGFLTRVAFDYTKWRASLWPDVDVEQLSQDAMRLRDGRGPEPDLLTDVQQGLADVEAGRVVPHDEARARLLARYK